MAKIFQSRAGAVTRAAAELHLGDQVRDVLLLVGADGQGRPAVFAVGLRADGADYEAGDWVPAAIRDGVLSSCLKLGRIDTADPPAKSVLVPLAEEQIRSRKPQVPAETETNPGPGETSPPGGQTPAWLSQPVEQLFSKPVVKKLAKAGVATAGDLDRWADEHEGLAGLELTEKEKKAVCDVMAAISKGGDAPPDGDDAGNGPEGQGE